MVSHTTAPTCTQTGVKIYSCIFCEEIEREELPKSDHNYYWDGSDMMRTHMCSYCDYVGITEYNIGGAWGYYDDEVAEELWEYINGQRNATQYVDRDVSGNAIGIKNVASLEKREDLVYRAGISLWRGSMFLVRFR